MAQLVLTSDTLAGTPATGTLEYNGQFFGTDSNASRAQMQRITLATAVASTSGTSIDFTSIPAWVKRITVMLDQVSGNGTSVKIIQIGTSGGIQTSGYSGASQEGSTGIAFPSNGYALEGGTAASLLISGVATLVLLNSSTGIWAIGGTTARANSTSATTFAGTKSLSGTLDRVRITMANGTDTFDAGSVNILYEG